MTRNNDKKREQVSYPVSLWPMILNRLLMHLHFPSYGFFGKICNRRIDNEGLFDGYEDYTKTHPDNDDIDDHGNRNDNKDITRRRATVVYHLLMRGIVTDLQTTG